MIISIFREKKRWRKREREGEGERLVHLGLSKSFGLRDEPVAGSQGCHLAILAAWGREIDR